MIKSSNCLQWFISSAILGASRCAGPAMAASPAMSRTMLMVDRTSYGILPLFAPHAGRQVWTE